MKDNFNIHDWRLNRVIESNLSDAELKSKKRVDVMTDRILKSFPELNVGDLRVAVSSALVDFVLQGLMEEKGYSPQIGDTEGLTSDTLEKILLAIAKDGEELDETQFLDSSILLKLLPAGIDQGKLKNALASTINQFLLDNGIDKQIATKDSLGKLAENIVDNSHVVSLEDLDWDMVQGLFPNIKPGFGGVRFPNPDDSSRMVGAEHDLESWKQDTLERYGNVQIELDPNASKPWDKVKILNNKFQSDKERYTKGKAAWLDQERAAGISID